MGKHLKTMRITGKLASWIVVFSMLLELFSMPSSIAHAAYTEDPTQVEEIVSDGEAEETTIESEDTTEATTEYDPVALVLEEKSVASALEDLIVSSGMILTENKTVQSLSVKQGATLDLNGYELSVEGDALISGNVEIGDGTLSVAGNLKVEKNGSLLMENPNSLVVVNGDYYDKGTSKLTAGEIQLYGNFSAGASFKAENAHRTSFLGTAQQEVYLDDGGSFGIVDVRNYGEGILVKYAFAYSGLLDNGCTISYDTIEGERGYTLTEDETREESLVLATGTLDLAGHKMTIEGDLVIAGGTVKLSGGELHVTGDVRIQSRTVDRNETTGKTTVSYGTSAGVLLMQNDNDHLVIDGSFISAASTTDNGNLTAGTMEVAGDITVTSRRKAFAPSEDFMIVLDGSKKQTIDLYTSTSYSYRDSYNYVGSLTCDNTSEEGIVFAKDLYVRGLLTVSETTKISGTLLADTRTSFANHTYTGTVKLSDSIENLTVYGDVIMAGDTYVSSSFVIHGNLSGTGILMVADGSVIVDGDVTGIKLQTTSGYTNSRILVHGDLNSPLVAMGGGTIELKGNLDASSFNANTSNTSTLLFSGDDRQDVTGAANMHLDILELQNESEEGVVFDAPVDKKTLIRNGSRLRYAGLEGEFGWKLTEDTTYTGNLVILDDTMDLNGHKLTVTGDYVQISGDTVVAGGELAVKGDLRLQSYTAGGAGQPGTYGVGTAGLVMTNASDRVTVEGDMYVQTSRVNGGSLTAGTLDLKGDLTVYNTSTGSDFLASGSHTTTFSGKKKQTITIGDYADAQCSVLSVTNASSEGVEIPKGVLKVSKSYTDGSCKVSGWIGLLESCTTETEISASVEFTGARSIGQNIKIHGDARSAYDPLTINQGSTLTVYGDFDAWGTVTVRGTLDVEGNATENQQGRLSIPKTGGYIKVLGNLTSRQSQFLGGTTEVLGNVSGTIAAKNNHVLLISGTNPQTLDISISSSLATVELTNTSGSGVTAVRNFAKTNLVRNGVRFRYLDMEGEFGWTLSEDETWDGNLTLIDDTLDLAGHTLTVDGNFTVKAGAINLNGGTLHVTGDMIVETPLTLSGSVTVDGSVDATRASLSVGGILSAGSDFSGKMNLLNQNAKLIVAGNTTLSNCENRMGTIECKGDVTIGSSAYIRNDAKLILSGDALQVIDAPIGTSISRMEIQNESAAGVYAKHYIVTDNLITNGNTYKTGAGDYIVGYKLTEDTTITGDLWLGYGVLDLNGYTLTVTGDMVHAGGEVMLNGGCLHVMKDYIGEIRDKDDSGNVVRSDGRGKLTMTDERDIFDVDGSFILAGNATNLMQIRKGNIKIGGGINLSSDLTLGTGTKLILDREKLQKISGSGTMIAHDIVISNPVGIELIRNLRINGTPEIADVSFSGTGALVFPGFSQVANDIHANVILAGNTTLDKDIKITGNLTINGSLNLAGHVLEADGITVNSSVTLAGGTLYARDNLIVANRGILTMNTAEDMLVVGRDMTFSSGYQHRNYLTAGTIRLYRNFTANSNFAASGTHKTILERRYKTNGTDYIQTVSIDGTTGKFHTLVLNREESKYVFSRGNAEAMAEEVVVNEDAGRLPDPLLSITEGEKDIDHVTLDLHPASDSRADYYEVYRGGVRQGVTTTLAYTDKNLSPDTAYTYQVYPVMKDGRKATASPEVTIRTSVDETAPSAPTDLSCISVTGSSVSISWSPATDNDKVLSYMIYMDGTFVKSSDELKEKITGLAADEEHEITVVACDPAGNASERSEILTISAKNPEITKTIPENGASAESLSEIRYQAEFSLLASADTYRAGIYIVSGTERTAVAEDLVPTENSSGKGCVSYTIDLASYHEDGIDILLVLSDEDGNSTENTVHYEIDRRPPAKPTDLTVTDDNGVSVISFTPSGTVDCAGYRVYRADGESYAKIADIPDRYTDLYKDTETEEGKTYAYKVTAYDKAGNENALADVAFATVTTGHDGTVPSVKDVKPAAGTISGETEITISAEDNKASDHIELKIGRDGEDSVLLETVDIDPKTVSVKDIKFTLDTNDYADGVWFVYVTAYDTAGNESASYKRRYEIDNIGPGEVTGLNVVPHDTSVYLTWNDVDDTDFAYFLVEEKKGNTYTEVARVENTIGTNLTGLEPESTHTYRVCAVDQLGNRGVASSEVTITLLADTTAPVIKSITPQEGDVKDDIRLTLTVSDNVRVKEGIFSYATDGQDFTEFARVTNPGWRTDALGTPHTFSATLTIADLPEGDVTINFTAYDSAGNKNAPLSDGSELTATYTIDRTAPQAPSHVTAVSGMGYIRLTWDGITDTDGVGHLKIYRADSEEKVYRAVADKVRSADWYDTAVTPGQTYLYCIRSVDAAGNVSAESDTVVASATKDTKAPEILGITPKDGELAGKSISVSATAGDDANLADVLFEYLQQDTGIWKKTATVSVSGRYGVAETMITAPDGADTVTIRVRARDAAGNFSAYTTTTCHIVREAPGVRLSASNGARCINVSYESSEASKIASATLYRRLKGENEAFAPIANMSKRSFTDKPDQFFKEYEYKLKITDIYGNERESAVVTAYATDEDTEAPVAVLPERLTVLTGFEFTLDGGLCTDNCMIASYKWDFPGENVLAGGRSVTHKYDQPGEYKIKLAVTDAAGNTAETETTVRAIARNGAGTAKVYVVDDYGRPVPYALVYVNDATSKGEAYQADGAGVVTIAASKGTHRVAAYADGYIPKDIEIVVSNVQELTYELVIPKDQLVVGEFRVKKLTPQEMADAGVDFSDPANLHRYTMEITVWFDKKPIPVVIDYNQGAGQATGGDSDDSGGFGTVTIGGDGKSQNGEKLDIIPLTSRPDPGIPMSVPTMIAYVRTTQTVSWLKDMYNVELGILNTAEETYVIEDASATLVLPDGLSLAALTKTQDKKVDFGNIKGQEVKNASWIVKGDKPGSYQVEADFSGVLMPFESEVKAHFISKDGIMIGDFSGLLITISMEETAYADASYYFQFKVENGTGRPLYNFTTTFGDYRVPATKSYVYIMDPDSGQIVDTQIDSFGGFTKPEMSTPGQTTVLQKGQSLTIPTLLPGQIVYGTYAANFYGDDPMRWYYEVAGHMVEILEGSDLGVSVETEIVPGHVSKIIYCGVNLDPIYYGDPVDVRSGAFTDEIETMSVMGKTNLSVDLSYNSYMHDKKGEAGYGWSHNLESRLFEDDGMIHVSFGPGSTAAFVSESSLDGKFTGEIEEGKLVLAETTEGEEITYRSITSGMEDYTLIGHADHTYTLLTPNKTVLTYDSDGRLSSMTDEEGNRVTASYEDHKAIFTDAGSTKRLILTYNDEGNLIAVSDDTGRKSELFYTDGMLTTYVNPMGERISYTYDDEGCILTAANGNGDVFLKNRYDSDGRVVWQKEAGGNIFEYAYTEEGNDYITTCTDQSGTSTFRIDKSGNIKEVTAPTGATETSTYDRYGNKTAGTDAYGNTNLMTYDEKGRLTHSESSDGQRMDVTYDDKDHITSLSDGNTVSTFVYDADGHLTEGTDGDYQVRYLYDGEGNLTGLTKVGKGTEQYSYDPTGSYLTAFTDAAGHTTTYTYDERGNRTSVTNALGATISLTYDLGNRLTSVTYPNGGTESYTYDIYGNTASVTDLLGNTTAYEYDTAGRRTKTIYPDGSEETYVNDRMGNPVQVVASDGSVTTLEYDNLGNVTKISYPDGRTEERLYDEAGQLLSVTDAGGAVTSVTRDTTGKVAGMVLPDGSTVDAVFGDSMNPGRVTSGSLNGHPGDTLTYDRYGNVNSVTDAAGNKTLYNYNAWGELLSETDAEGRVTRYDYDAVGNCIKATTPSGGEIHFTYDAAGRMIRESQNDISCSYTYDSMGNVISKTDEVGNKTRYEYDLMGHTTKVIDPTGYVAAECTYDELGRPATETVDGVTTSYTYNQKGLVQTAVEKTENGETKTTSYTYDEAGRLLSVTDPAGVTSSQTYDDSDNVTGITYPGGGGVSYTYDTMGRVTEEKLSIGTKETYTYDDDGFLKEYTNGRGQKCTYTYDLAGRLKTVTDEVGKITLTHDKVGNILEVKEESNGKTTTIKRTYDAMNRVTSKTDANGKIIRYSYDELGNLVSLTYPGGEIVRYAYYPDGSLREMTDGKGRKTNYTYDKCGRVLTTTKPDGSVETNTYDEAGRLKVRDITVKGKTLVKYTYTHDEWGNITNIKTDGALPSAGITESYTKTMTYDECNRMISYNGHEVLYDADGNMTYGPLSAVEGEDDTFVHFEYDSRNRLTKAGDTSYIYDAENNRIGVSTPAYTEIYVVDDNCTLSQNIEISRTFRGKNGMSDTTVVEKYYYGNGLVYETTQPTENSTDDNLLVYHFNHLGSTVAVTNETGEILGDFSYGTYGELLSDTTKESSFTPRYLYNGQMGVISDANGLVYMRSRYYNPTIKRFINRDILTGNISNNKSLNQYCYVEGNPVSYTDPFGLNPYAQALGALHSTFREMEMFVRTIASPLVHTALDILGALPGGAIFDFINAGLYYAEGNKYEARKSIIFAIPGLDLIGKAGKLSVKGTKLAKAGAEALQVVDKVGKIGSIYFSAKDFGNDIARMIDKYMVEGQEFSLVTVLELAELGGHAFQLDAFTKPYMTRITGEDVKAGLGKIKDGISSSNRGIVNFPGTKRISYTEYETIMQKSIHNPGKDVVMLGKYDGGGPTSYINRAGTDYTYFDLGKDWDFIKKQHGLSDKEMFKLFNESFLDDGIISGKTFSFSHNPIDDDGALGKEFLYLKENGYMWDATTMTMRPKHD